MLRITINGEELFDEKTRTFVQTNGVSFDLEHSLVSLSKWEAIHKVPFLSSRDTTNEQMYDYIACMIVTPGIDRDVVYRCTQEDIARIQEYINSEASATTFARLPEKRGQGETITSELIYYWMTAFQVPFDAENWHLNRLFSLIRVANVKNSKPSKRSPREIAEERNRINAERRAQLGTNG